MRATSFIGPVALLAALATPAAAQAPGAAPAPSASQPEGERIYYGYQIIAADAASLGVALLARNIAPLIAGYAIGGPVVHFVNRNPKVAGGSIALRAGVPMLGFLIGFSSDTNFGDDFDDELERGAVGALVGMGIAAVVDWTLLGWRRRAPQPPRAVIRLGSLRANPAVVGGPDAPGLGLRGWF